jgi:fatty acid desaturase
VLRDDDHLTLATEPRSTHNVVPVALYKLRSSIWVTDLLFDWAVIVATFAGFAYLDSLWLIPVAALIIGARQHGLGLLGHDATHRLAFKNRRLNDIVGELFTMWPILVLIDDGYRPWHFDHHRTLGTEDDPELHYRSFRPYTGPVTLGKAIGMFLFDMTGLGIFGLLRFQKEILPYQQPRRILGPLVMWSVFFGVTYYFGALWIFFLWTWSLITGFWAVFRVRTWTEHLNVPSKGKETSHRFRAGWIARFLFVPHNTYCHYEHHKWPQIPYYNLPRMRELDGSKPVATFSDLFPRSLPAADLPHEFA